MVHVIEKNIKHLQVIMDDKTCEPEEKEKDPEFLPSMGLSAFLSNPEDVRNFMSRIRQFDGLTSVPPSDVSKAAKKSASKSASGGLDGTMGPPNTQPKRPSFEPQPGTSRNYQKPGYQQSTLNQDGNLFPLTNGNTTPIASTTINMEHLGEISEDYDTKGAIFSAVTQIPELEVKTADYARFRYASERPDKGKKTRQYEMDEDKRFMADVKVTNYTGSATVIIHCVDSRGQLHPYHLDGEDCNNGVYYKRFEFSARSPVLKITKTTVIQPKTKEYENSIRDQKSFLSETNALEGTEKCCTNPKDKQCIHFHVKVLLDSGSDGRYLHEITSAIRNKKDGTEFKIHAITPPSAKANGAVLKHLGKSVFIMVTNETAFPKDVCLVVFRNKEIGWEKVLRGEDIKVIKKAVVEFTPPPYADTSITENVEVDVCLRDGATGKETEPTKFLYIGDEYGINAKKAKKRKIEDLDEQGANNYEPDIQAQRKIMHALRKHVSSSPAVSDHTNSSDDNTPHNSLGCIQDDNMITGEYQPEQTADVQHVANDISLENRRANKLASTHQPQVSTTVNMLLQPGLNFSTPIGGGMSSDTQQPFVMQPSSQIVTSADSVYSNTLTQSIGEQASISRMNNYLQPQQQPMGNQEERSFDPSILQQMSQDMLVRLVDAVKQKKIILIPEFEDLMWKRMAQVFETSDDNVSPQDNLQQTAQVNNIQVEQPQQNIQPTPQQNPQSTPQSTPQVQSLSDLPPLPPDLHYAIIQGQIMVLRNDIQDPSPPVQSQPVNIAGQNVVIQPMEPQHPSDLQLPSDLLKSDYFNQLFGQREPLSSSSNIIEIQTSTANQPRQPPPEFWRAITGTSSNLEDDDDIEIDSGRNPFDPTDDKANSGPDSIKGGAADEMDVDNDNEGQTDMPAKVHGMKLRGKKINYQNALRDYEDVLSDIRESGDDMVDEGEKDIDNDEVKKYVTPKKKYTRGMEKRNPKRGKALYEDDVDDNDDVNEIDKSKASLPSSGKNGGTRSRGKDIKLVKKLLMADTDEDSEGFECMTDS